MSKRHIIQIVIFFLIAAGLNAHAQSPKARSGTFALTNASIETVTKGVIQNGTVVISGGKIVSVGTDVAVPPGAQVVDCKGLWIYPGMIDSGTQLGLQEVASDPRTNDFSEVGDIVPQVKALTAVNPNSALIPVTRIAGITTVLSVPRSDLMPGTAALINLHGYTPDQMYAGFQAVVLNFPRDGKRGGFDRRTDEEIKKEYEKKMTRINDVWEKAVQYYKLDSATQSKGTSYYPEMEALLPAVKGEQPLLIVVNAAKDIKAALKWVSERKIKKVIFSGMAEGWRLADEIGKAGIPAIVGPTLAVPTRDYDRYDRAYANAGLMRKAGVKVMLSSEDGQGNVRNLPYHAGFAAAYGLGREEALKAVTIVPAEVFGVSAQLGSIEVGKNATLFISDGDPFETKTSIKHVFIDGWQIPMVSRQTELYEEFLKREPGVTKN